MKKQYFAWKDRKQAKDGRQEWIEIMPKEYREIYEKNKVCPVDERRYFASLPGVEKEDIYYCFECDYKQYKKYRAEKEQKARKEKADKEDEIKYGSVRLLSLDAEFVDDSGDPYSLHDMIADEDSLFENELIKSLMFQQVLNALSKDERELIYAIYLSDNPMTIRDYAEITGVHFTTVNYRKKKILEKLRELFIQN